MYTALLYSLREDCPQGIAFNKFVCDIRLTVSYGMNEVCLTFFTLQNVVCMSTNISVPAVTVSQWFWFCAIHIAVQQL